ncbi:MAG: 30S ribosomal protein S6, partial [Parcubacteria group bacterium GW2011_GWC1_40_13]
MQTYELTYIISPEMTSEDAETKSKEIASTIQGNEGIIVKQTNPLPKALAFPVKKHASGFFGVFEFQMEQEKLSAVQEMVKKDAKIVRHIVLVKKPFKIKKERRSKKKDLLQAEALPSVEAKKPKAEKEEVSEPVTEEKTPEKVEKAKVELKDIEKQLDDIL